MNDWLLHVPENDMLLAIWIASWIVWAFFVAAWIMIAGAWLFLPFVIFKRLRKIEELLLEISITTRTAPAETEARFKKLASAQPPNPFK